MSIQLGKLCSRIIEQHFGEVVRTVVDDLFASIAKPLSQIIRSTGLTKSEVCKSLAILIKFNMVGFSLNKARTGYEYRLHYDRIVMVLRYPRYVHLIQTKFGHESAVLMEELLRSGTQCASYIIVKSMSNVDGKDNNTLALLRDKFADLAQENYITRAPEPKPSDGGADLMELCHDIPNPFLMPELDLRVLKELHEGKPVKVPDEDVHWVVNVEQFHIDFRNTIMVTAIERLIDSNAGECMKYLLQLMRERTNPWEAVSNPIALVDLRQRCERKSQNVEMLRYLDQYISVMESNDYLSKFDTKGGGQFTVNVKRIFEQLTWACIENIIVEKYGSKAARIFRVVRMKKYVEQEDIQKEAMVPAKDAKLLTYKLLEENFLQIQTFRKPGGGNSGAPKSFFLFYVNQPQIVSMLLELSYKALYNSITRLTHDKTVNKRLIEKSQRLESIVETMKERGESEAYINEILETLTPPEQEILAKVKLRVKSLYSAEIGIDETIFMLKLYQEYQK
ncbi:DNA-directed RNA polymerase III subunit RPC3 [Anopheles merus]|uniref:DNA-directed RNA polymerase III subunit RPC3 n=2 Tax=gambiae species complex TaxID=44542 RepID=Q7QC11_ANOGA|nr:DNA-directed RNA polymerase III subunit RPC3 [Anopheles merus]XP_312561.3 DNA-directed RNA polymerase III subunit RPC3 [Anopheles gambiae]EAA08103.3 AGAP002394-PA [Anopheles gambiae str. PEST]